MEQGVRCALMIVDLMVFEENIAEAVFLVDALQFVLTSSPMDKWIDERLFLGMIPPLEIYGQSLCRHALSIGFLAENYRFQLRKHQLPLLLEVHGWHLL